MRGKVSLAWRKKRTVFTALWCEQDQVGKLACCEPWEPAAVLHAPKCQASVTFEAVPAEVGGLKSFTGHGLDGIPENRLHLSDFCSHVGPVSRVRDSDLEPRSNSCFLSWRSFF